ncbi:unnamed protein product [Microthlaspi erraticum]|uniref:Arabidopsis retrotransposon Orf1 C-terminal domain-containing protein n=1 Tax=Microthlaspi erraticum TaxID=1685480 RepID=A0A6D2I6P0_9BRAS|nr:unnamed protein product [Microthlaspi erraticum]
MATTRKRGRSQTSSPTSLPPWPREDGTPIPSGRVWDRSPQEEIASDDCIYRDISESWDEYDTLFYNAWLKVDIRPTRFAQEKCMRVMGIRNDVIATLKKIGLGTICTEQHDLYPELTGRESHFQQSIWDVIAHGRYDSRGSAQTDVRHPVLRYVIRLIANTILCKSEPGKIRLGEFMLLSYGLDDLHEEGKPKWKRLRRINFGALFAHHLASLKAKPFSTPGPKFETVGSLLTPIFQHLNISLADTEVIGTRSSMDEAHLKSAKWLKTGRLWCFRVEIVDYMVRLPEQSLTTITESRSSISFLPEPRYLLTPPLARSHTGSTPRTRVSRSAADIPSTSSTVPPALSLPAAPPIPMETEVFQRYMVESIQSIWSRISHCGCMRDDVDPSASHSAAPPPGDDDTTED